MKKTYTIVLLSLSIGTFLPFNSAFCVEKDQQQLKDAAMQTSAPKKQDDVPDENQALRELAKAREAREKKVVIDEVLIRKVILEQGALLEKQEKPAKKNDLFDVASPTPHTYSQEDYRAWVGQLQEDELWKVNTAEHNIEYFIRDFKYGQKLRQQIAQENQQYEELMKQREQKEREEQERIQKEELEYQAQQEARRLEEEEASRRAAEKLEQEDRDREYAESLQHEMGALTLHPVHEEAPALVLPHDEETFDEWHLRNPGRTYEDWLQQL
jgi:hypothetical protein